MNYLLFIALGGASGAVLRYLVSIWVSSVWEGRLPLGTLMINLLGSFAIGIVFVLIEKQHIHADWKGVLMVGLLGAFTTFSTFSLETVSLIEAGDYLHAVGYMFVSVLCCVGATAAAISLTRMLSASL